MNSPIAASAVSDDAKPWLKPWPSDDLQSVSKCPVCGSPDRKILHDELIDNVFFVAPGYWTLHQCETCKSAYLDPRPDEKSIGKAYSSYYTHTSSAGTRTPTAELSLARRLMRWLANGYLNRRYETNRFPAVRVGSALLKLFPRGRQMLDGEFRFLPKPRPFQKLLDIGCGNGAFLSSAGEAGWDVAGVDPDIKAAATANKLGFEVRHGSIELFDGLSSLFDAITLSHVIEHVHEPRTMIQAAFRLLKPGGVLYVETPNIESRGALIFGKAWRGLETPRHLVVFSPTGLTRLLHETGFSRSHFKSRNAFVRRDMDIRSLRIGMGRSPYDDRPVALPLTMLIAANFPRSRSRDEFLTVLAWKAG